MICFKHQLEFGNRIPISHKNRIDDAPCEICKDIEDQEKKKQERESKRFREWMTNAEAACDRAWEENRRRFD